MEFILTFVSGINLAFAALSFFVFRKNIEQKFYLYFGLFSLFSGFYFMLNAISNIVEIDIRWAILLCAAAYYAIFPWFVLEFIHKKPSRIAWPISTLFAIAITVFILNPDPHSYALWQILAHLGLIGLLGVTYYASMELIKNKRKGRKEFLVLTVVFILFGLEEIISNYSGYSFLTRYISGIMPLDIYPLLFTFIIGFRLANEVYINNSLKIQLIESRLSEEKLKLEEMEKEVLEEKLSARSKDLTDFGIEITRKKSLLKMYIRG